MFYDIGIFSITYSGMNIPTWFTHTSNGFPISFTVPSSTQNLRGLNVGYVYTVPPYCYSVLQEIIHNRTKKLMWLYEPCLYGVTDSTDDKNIVYVRHWVIGKGEMEEGDNIYIFTNEKKNIHDATVTQCGFSFVYDDGNSDADPLAIYKQQKYKSGRREIFRG